MASHHSARMPLIDALKAVASQLIVLHHLAAYGPLSEAVQAAAPNLISWLYDYARIAVQVFLVVAGFLAARGLAPQGVPVFENPLALVWRRYQRLVLPYLAAIALAMLCAALARRWMVDDDMVPAAPGLLQWLAHAALLHGVLGVESLSAGVWYVAIDFQLFALMAACLWLGRLGRLGRYAPLLALGLGAAALFHFNRDASWDNWAVYFFGSYALGAAAWWASGQGRMAAWLGVILTVGIAALVVDFRLRIAVALASALLLGCARRSGGLERWLAWPPFAFLGQVSYSVFLAHFPVCLLVNGLFASFGFASPAAGAVGMVIAWAASIAAGALFHRYVESTAPAWKLGSRTAALLRSARQRLALKPFSS